MHFYKTEKTCPQHKSMGLQNQDGYRQKTAISSVKWRFLLLFIYYLILSRNSVGDIPVIFWKFLYAVERWR